MTKKKTVNAVCDACRGTGVYSGMCEGQGHAVVCLGCEGTGCHKIEYQPFKKRQVARGIKTVDLQKNNFVLIVDGIKSNRIERYSDFRRGKVQRDKRKLV